MNDLKDKIADVVENWKYNKICQIEIDTDTDFVIHNETQRAINRIYEELEELDSGIDEIIEEMNKPSDYEIDLEADNRNRARELVYGG